MGRQPGKRQVMVYLPEKTYRRLKVDAAHKGLSMSTIVERALEVAWGARPATTSSTEPEGLSTEPEHQLSPAEAALVLHGAPLMGEGDSSATLEEAVALGLQEARLSPTLFRVFVVVLVKNKDADWPAILDSLRQKLPPDDLRVLGVLFDLAASAGNTPAFREYADVLLTQVGAISDPVPIFTRPYQARYSMALRERTPKEMLRWGFVCATPLDDFQEAVRRFCR